MTDFRVIAIRTGEKPQNIETDKNGVKLEFLKVLAPNTLYPFYNHIEFPKKDFSEIIYNERKDIDLYSLKNGQNNIHINVNAVVGSNGSGKSTLIELLFWANYNIGSKLGLLVDDKGKKYPTYDFLDLEIFYSLSKTDFFKIRLKEGEILKQNFSIDKTIITPIGEEKQIRRITDLTNFFYSLVINYSHYALNSLEIGDWINPLFHKNDGYQTPIVLNPMRKNGDIEINKEKYLLGRRLQANLLEYVKKGKEKESLRDIANGKLAYELKLLFSPEVSLKRNLMEQKNSIIFNDIKSSLGTIFDLQISSEDIDNNLFVIVSLNYIFEKLVKIAHTYKPYAKFKKGKEIHNIEEFLKAIKNSNSHITFKLKGAILYLKYFSKIFGDSSIDFKNPVFLQIDELSNLIIHINNNEPFLVNTFMMAPPSYFNVEILLEGGLSFHSLSSGEKQRIHSISSIVYHLMNLNSVEEQKLEMGDKYIGYNYINLVLDEIELYYHPEWQRKYIADLMAYIGKINPNNLKRISGLNITFLTHSPYILSDIPSSNIMFLKLGTDGYSRPKDEPLKTFGANIHDLLKDGFFMETGFIGEYAKVKIIELLDWLKVNNNQVSISERDNYSKLIDLLGDPIIKNRLKDLFHEKFNEPTYSDLLQEIKYLKSKN